MAMNIMGMPVFVDYYTIHDPVTGKVGYVPHNTSAKKDLEAGVASTTQFLEIGETGGSMNGTALFISWSLSLVMMYLIFDYWNAFIRPS